MIITTIEVEGGARQSPRDPEIPANFVSQGYFETLGTPLLAVRDFDPHDMAGSAKVAIVNQAAARKYFDTENPVGRYYCGMGRPVPNQLVKVIGVVKDAKYIRLREKQPAIAYLPEGPTGPSVTFNLRRTAGPSRESGPGGAGRYGESESCDRIELPFAGGPSVRIAHARAVVGGAFGIFRRLGSTACRCRTLRRHLAQHGAAARRDRHPHGSGSGANARITHGA